MKFLLLIYADPLVQSAAPEEALREMYRAYGAFTAELAASGKLGPAEELQPADQAKSVRIRDGRTLVTDGPFAEVREQLGGFYVIEAQDIDEAVAWAARVPSAPFGTIEVRPLASGQYPDPGLTAPSATQVVVERVFREEQGRAVAGLIRVLRDFDLAEEAVQDAFVVALERWPSSGVPDNPGAWIVTTARNKAIDRLRRSRRLLDKEGLLRGLAELDAAAGAGMTASDPGAGESGIDDDRLRLIFTCCHPALAPEARVALTLRTLGGLTTPEIARAFLVPEPTLAQRLVRARKKIRDAGIPYRVPPAELLPERLDSVLAVLYLVFNEGYAATSDEALIRRELCEEGIRLARLMTELMPDEPEAHGLLALMLLHDARRAARVDAAGELVLLEDQDRSRWDGARIAEGALVLDVALLRHRPGPYQTQAAIAAVHCGARTAAATDWPQICALYDVLLTMVSSPVVELNRAVAVAMRDGPAAGLEILDGLAARGDLAGYHLFHAARADLLRREGRWAESADAYRAALRLATNPTERRFLERRLRQVGGARPH